MYNEVLKYGSMIVDALIECTQPVFVYIPPKGELRGGAWVVLDPTINSEVMEMYADLDSRGGVLEPAGLVEIKYRSKDLLHTMHRLDPKLLALSQAADEAESDEVKREILREIKQRERDIKPFYEQVALQFADMHDTPGRMLAKGVINDKLQWKGARRFFFWRLRRRLQEMTFVKELKQAGVSHDDATRMLAEWLIELAGNGGAPVSDEQAFQLLQEKPPQMVRWQQEQQVHKLVSQLQANPDISIEAVVQWVSSLDGSAKAAACDAFSRLSDNV